MKFISATLLLIAISFACRCQIQSSAIREKIKLLQPFEGKWVAEVKLHSRDGRTVEEAGTYDISWVLDCTYLQWQAYLRSKKDTNWLRNFIIFITYNPDSSRYENLYLYRASAMKVFEHGSFNPVTKEYTTSAFIPLEDGSHDEHVRTITKISGDNNHVTYVHFSRYSDEKEETLDFEADLKRID